MLEALCVLTFVGTAFGAVWEKRVSITTGFCCGTVRCRRAKHGSLRRGESTWQRGQSKDVSGVPLVKTLPAGSAFSITAPRRKRIWQHRRLLLIQTGP